MSTLMRQALDLLNEQIANGTEYADAHAFVVATLGLSEEQAADLAQTYDTQAQRRAS